MTEELAVLHCVNIHVKSDGGENAGGGQDAQLAGIDPVKRDLPAVLGHDVDPERAALYKEQPQAFVVGPVDG